MAKRIGTSRTKSRSKFTKHLRKKGKISIRRCLQKFDEGEKVRLLAEPAVQNGLYHARFHSKCGIISGKQGRCYKVAIKDFKKEKVLIINPAHLRKILR